ncbi:16S rRNA (guanine1516-N2)-methyltransferase [Andreprevotia lacus DSM 23236]|jgi:16S rRNA (guanine1516-N2)-methyltransferase|uniref:Ribosomal RNA small subunit methyltransferase J n=1 Tax=Andreprevotia lacus DSM 23236 TaxID=1121001 RepID=A0A1W1XJV5_9NEIS|nr:class I SAM-dependent methyltransferase [Andreprevotia lacus]SMC24102.1 16S rRNA (guanine1516-N2)-methyltransferase [Andreprevotia lacus DSM 23236]
MTGLISNGSAAAEVLANRFGLPLQEAPPAQGHYLVWENGMLALAEAGDKARVSVDFVAGAQAHRRKFGGGLGQPVARAVGLKQGQPLTVLDATAGQGRDAFVLASLGATVTLLERSAVACALLADGLARAAADEATAPIAARMQLVHADALQWLRGCAQQFEVVFLDPMFPEPGKRAKSKKDMAAFQTLIGGDVDADGLLAPARRLATRRVVVKRPRIAPWLNQQKPDFDYPGESTRFDAYLPRCD